MRALFAFAAFCACWLAATPPAHALVCLLGCACTVTASDIEFDDFNPLTAAEETAIGEIDLHCTGLLSIGAGVTVEVLQGQWGAYAARKMRASSGDMIDYNIYTSSAHTNVWGAGAQAVQISGGLIALGAWSARRDMFARLQANPAMKPGDYADTVVVRVIW